MKRMPTIILRAAIIFVGLLVLTACFFLLKPAVMPPDDIGDYYPIVLLLLISAIPFFYTLYQAMRLLKYIDTNLVFSDLATGALRHIQYSAATICGLYTAGLPFIYRAADNDDAPGVVALGCIVIFVSFVITVAAAVFERLLQAAIDIKSENDLTV